VKINQILIRLLISMLIFAPAFSQAAEGDIWSRDKLLGDVGGARSFLGEHGIAVDVRLNQYYQDVTDGGERENGEYGGKLDYIVNVDGEKLGLWKGLFLNLHAEYQYGDSVLADAGGLSLVNTAMLYPAPGNTSTEVTGWSVTQGLYHKGDTAIALMAGKIHVADLLNTAWPFLELGKNGFMNYNVNLPVGPLARYLELAHLGTGLLVFNKRDIKAAVAVLDTSNSTTTSGFNKLGDNGVTVVGLYRFFFDIKDKPGRLTLLAASSTGSYSTLEETVFYVPVPGRNRLIFAVPGLENEPQRNPWTAMAYYDQVIWQAGTNGKRNIRFVAAGAIADQKPSYDNWQYSGQLVATGFFDSRPLDKIGVGGYYVGVNSQVKETSQASALIPQLGDYSGLEIFYSAAITPAVHLTGDLQIADGLVNENDTAIIPGVRLAIDF
jgi:porin